VSCLWERSVSADDPPRALVLPDGCVDLVWVGDRLVVAGPDRGPVLSRVTAGETVVGIRFRPGLAGTGLGLPAEELSGTRTGIAEVWGRAGRDAEERLGDAETPGARRDLLARIVATRRSSIEDPDPVVLEAVRRLGRPRSRVGELSRELYTSERQLLRRFRVAVGYGPKMLDRVLRFQRFLARAPSIRRGDDELARLAVDLGYSDQAHLSRESRALSGRTPSALIAEWVT
jgi:AraC-like DNA-binding protein